MSYFDRQGIPEEVLKMQLQRDESQNLAKKKNGINNEEFENVEDGDMSESDDRF